MVKLEDFEMICRFAEQFKLRNVPNEVIQRAKLIMLDSLTAIVHGNQTNEVLSLTKELSSKHEASNLTSVYGTNYKTELHLASMINALAMVSEEMDEGNPLAKGHPSCHFFPALLTVAERDELSGEQLLESFILGYEIGARAGAATVLKENIHPHGNWGIIGAAFAIGKLYGFNSCEYLRALSLNGSIPYPTLWKPVLNGHRIRDVLIGLNNLNAILIPFLLKAGYSGELSSIEEIFREIIGEKFDSSKIGEDLGEQYYLMQTYFKFYPFCRFCHSPIDAILDLKSKEDFSLDLIDTVNVYTYSLASRLNKQNVCNEFAGKFSIPYAVASVLLEADRDQTLESESLDAKVTSLSKKIYVFEDKKLTELLPYQRNSKVELVLKNGKTIISYAQGAKGDHDTKDLEEKVIFKCKAMLTSVVGEKKAYQLIQTVLDLENFKDLNFMFSLIRK